MLKKTLIFFAILFLTAIEPSLAAESFVTVVNPVRGYDFWDTTGQEPLSVVKDQLKVIEENKIAATWLLRPDVLFDENLTGYFKNFPKNQELGIFLEVTPAWAKAAGIKYRESPHWHFSRSVFLSGYEIPEREKLINTAAARFKSLFGGFSSVGAWHVDAYSAQYLRKNYGVTGVLICADQFSTDDYSIWGGWWGVPYYPAKTNILRPAKSPGEKLDVVIFWWAARDPLEGYGPGVGESTFSVQPNDYQGHGLGIDYFKKLAKIYLSSEKNSFGQLTIGLENTDNWANDKEEYFRQIDFVAKTYKVLTMKEFSLWYQKTFAFLSPVHKIEGETEPEGKAVWLMSPAGRVGYLEKDGQNILRDLRIYREGWPEPYLLTANPNLNFSLSLPAELDTVRFPAKEEKLSVAPEKLFGKPQGLPRLAAVKAGLPFSPSIAVYLLCAVIFLGFIIIAFKISKWLGLVTALGMAAQSATMVRSGLLSGLGMEFFGPNGHDGIWHLALINELGRRIPAQIPVFSGENLTNYHFIFDFLVALTNKITQIPIINLYFQIFPVIITGFLGFLGYRFMEKWTKS
ncbi:MAG: hypothetical protein Q8N98_00235, partial [bacterium]|nr:hypothetical protein [bacterium]